MSDPPPFNHSPIYPDKSKKNTPSARVVARDGAQIDVRSWRWGAGRGAKHLSVQSPWRGRSTLRCKAPGAGEAPFGAEPLARAKHLSVQSPWRGRSTFRTFHLTRKISSSILGRLPVACQLPYCRCHVLPGSVAIPPYGLVQWDNNGNQWNTTQTASH
eukprot:gene14109-biopygen14154